MRMCPISQGIHSLTKDYKVKACYFNLEKSQPLLSWSWSHSKWICHGSLLEDKSCINQ